MVMLVIFLCLVVAPAALGFLMNLSYFDAAEVGIGDPIVYCKNKASTHPGVRAHDVHPSLQGDYYYYLVNKYWTVVDVLGNGLIVAKTRTNKQHYLRPDDPKLRKAGLLERIRYGHRFPRLGEVRS